MKKARSVTLILAVLFALLLVACGGGEPAANTSEDVANQGAASEDTETVADGDPYAGEELFVQSCSACHGPDATGIEGLGRNLVTSEFVADQDNAGLLAFIKQGRPATHPDNITGIDMPPKGGNPALTDEQILDIIAFIREIHE